MNNLTKQVYEQQVNDCDGLCVITEEMITKEPELMRCVTCPFCKEIVNAELTPATIHCPACHVTVKR